MKRRSFDDNLVPESHHLEAYVAKAANELRAIHILSNMNGKLFVSCVHPFQISVGPMDRLAGNNIVIMASQFGTFWIDCRGPEVLFSLRSMCKWSTVCKGSIGLL